MDSTPTNNINKTIIPTPNIQPRLPTPVIRPIIPTPVIRPNIQPIIATPNIRPIIPTPNIRPISSAIRPIRPTPEIGVRTLTSVISDPTIGAPPLIPIRYNPPHKNKIIEVSVRPPLEPNHTNKSPWSIIYQTNIKIAPRKPIIVSFEPLPPIIGSPIIPKSPRISPMIPVPQLPIDAIVTIALSMTAKDLSNYCISNKNIAKICQSNEFYSELLTRKYGVIISDIPGTNLKEKYQFMVRFDWDKINMANIPGATLKEKYQFMLHFNFDTPYENYFMSQFDWNKINMKAIPGETLQQKYDFVSQFNWDKVPVANMSYRHIYHGEYHSVDELFNSENLDNINKRLKYVLNILRKANTLHSEKHLDFKYLILDTISVESVNFLMTILNICIKTINSLQEFRTKKYAIEDITKILQLCLLQVLESEKFDIASVLLQYYHPQNDKDFIHIYEMTHSYKDTVFIKSFEFMWDYLNKEDFIELTIKQIEFYLKRDKPHKVEFIRTKLLSKGIDIMLEFLRRHPDIANDLRTQLMTRDDDDSLNYFEQFLPYV